MLRYELKKLFSKHFGLYAVLLALICEAVYLYFAYPPRSFASEADKTYFEAYLSEFSGELTPEKEQAILAEQEAILDAYNAEQSVMLRLASGEFAGEAEFSAEMEKTAALTERKNAFELLLSEYEYAAEDRENRRILRGKYDGLASDFPDIFTLIPVVILTAILFLNEESSNVITYIRISKNGKSKALRAKLLSLAVLIFSVWSFRTAAELLIMGLRGGFEELLSPVQSIEFFGTSEYGLSILETLLAVSALRLFGYFFLSSVIVLFSVTLKKPLFTVFIPCAVCLLQQFAFTPATPAYYLPTGLLRAVGYFRGSDSEGSAEASAFAPPVKRFIAIPKEYLILIVVLTVVFIVFAAAAAARYYNGAVRRSAKRHAAVLAVMLLFSLSGCSEANRDKIVFNAGESAVLVQNADFYCFADENGLTAVSKKDGSEKPLLFDPFYHDSYHLTAAMCGGELYYYNRPVGADDFGINRISPYTLRRSEVNPPRDDISTGANYDAGFLGLSLKPNDTVMGSVHAIFTDGTGIFLIYAEGGVYALKGGKPECVIPERLYDESRVSFDGENIYYINKKMELKSYGTATGETERIAGGFSQAVYYDGVRLLYSNADGIFAYDPDDKTSIQLSSEQARQISSDGQNIVYSNGGALYLLGRDEPVCESEGDSFAVLSGMNKLAVRSGGGYILTDLP